MADPYIPVVAAVVLRGDLLLLCQRVDGPHLPLMWEFPGGKIDPGETPRGALQRELREELGVASSIGPLIGEVRHRYPDKRVWIRFYAAAIRGQPVTRVHRAVKWVPLADVARHSMPPPNAAVVERILRDGVEAVPAVAAPPDSGEPPASTQPP